MINGENLMNDPYDTNEAYAEGWDHAVDCCFPTPANVGDSPEDPNVISYLRGYLAAIDAGEA